MTVFDKTATGALAGPVEATRIPVSIHTCPKTRSSWITVEWKSLDLLKPVSPTWLNLPLHAVYSWDLGCAI